MPRLRYSEEQAAKLWWDYCDCGCTPGARKTECFECLARAIERAIRHGRRKQKR